MFLIALRLCQGKPGNTRSEIRNLGTTLSHTFPIPDFDFSPGFGFRISGFFDNPPPFAVYYASPGPPGGSTFVFGAS